MKDLNRMNVSELEAELSRLESLRTAACRVTPVFEPQSLGFVNDIDGNELAHCARKRPRLHRHVRPRHSPRTSRRRH